MLNKLSNLFLLLVYPQSTTPLRTCISKARIVLRNFSVLSSLYSEIIHVAAVFFVDLYMTENLHYHRSHDSLILTHSVQYHHFIKMVEYNANGELNA